GRNPERLWRSSADSRQCQKAAQGRARRSVSLTTVRCSLCPVRFMSGKKADSSGVLEKNAVRGFTFGEPLSRLRARAEINSHFGESAGRAVARRLDAGDVGRMYGVSSIVIFDRR